jgi:ADP-ribose diphosphatase
MMHQLPKILATRWSTRQQDTELLDLEFSNGVRREYQRVHPSGHGSVMIVALEGKNVLLTREYCCGTHRYELGLPRGRIDAGETALVAAQRELQEETGYGARQLHMLRTLALAPTYMSHVIHIVLAQELYPSRLEGDEPEPIEVVPYPFTELEALALNPEFTEGRALGALLAARAWLTQAQARS